MNRLHTATRGICSWREMLAKPDTQWERRYSAMETAVAWESAAAADRDNRAGLPEPMAALLGTCLYKQPVLLLAIAEHKVPLVGRGGDSQCDVWALVGTAAGTVSLSVEAKAQEPFGKLNQSLLDWLSGEKSDESRRNRQARWACVQSHLPVAVDDGYSVVAYQLLHRAAAAVIEARRFGLKHAAFVVQAFGSPAASFEEYAKLCRAMGLQANRGRMEVATVEDVTLGVGWADFPMATDSQIAAVA